MNLINKSHVRQFALDYARQIGRGEVIQRVGGEVYETLEGKVKAMIRSMVQAHPSAWRTLKP